MGTTTAANNLLALLFGSTRSAVLALLFSRVDESFYLRQIVRHVGAGLGAVQRELKRLGDGGIVVRRAQGRHVYYQANPACPIFPELRSLVTKTAGLCDVLRDVLLPLADRIQVAFVYGSTARAAATARSDVDLMVIGQVTFAEVVTALGPAQQRLGRDVNPTVYPPEEFQRKVREGHHFLNTVLREPKLFLMGGEHELGRLATERLADGAPDQPSRDRRPARRR